jgi:glycosyltransferase involved in cell wall biosynthesis
MKISVALCTCNGERYLPEQLSSIAGQTRLPDQLVVCDDASSDATEKLLTRFAESSSFAVNLRFNRERLGSTRNFEAAIRRCTGDVVVLSDQDDIWLPNRLADAEEAFSIDEQLCAVFSDAELINAHSQPLGFSLWQIEAFSQRAQKAVQAGRAFQVLLNRNVVTGATMAFRATMCPRILPIPPAWVHDGWIALVCSVSGKIGLLKRNAVQYRQHPAQQLGTPEQGLAAAIKTAQHTGTIQYVEMAAHYQLALDRVQSLEIENDAVISGLEGKIRHLSWRAQAQNGRIRNLGGIVRRCVSGDYFRFSDGWKSIAKDLILAR